jgi:DNA repair protein RadC
MENHMFIIQLTEEQIAAIQVRDRKSLKRQPRPQIRESKDAFELLRHMGQLSKEHCMVLTLDSRSQVIGKHEISVGTVDASLLHPREVFRVAIKDAARSLILAHNHPSGQLDPSEDDLLITKRIKTAGQIVGIPVVDHLIIGQGDFYSWRDNERM